MGTRDRLLLQWFYNGGTLKIVNEEVARPFIKYSLGLVYAEKLNANMGKI
jgi:hypothetical protein